jgi:hypothetical protein
VEVKIIQDFASIDRLNAEYTIEVIPKLTTKKIVNLLANKLNLAYKRFSVFMAKNMAPCIMKIATVETATKRLKGLINSRPSPAYSCNSFNGMPKATFPSIRPKDKAIVMLAKE